MSSELTAPKQTSTPRHHVDREPPRPVVIARSVSRRLPTSLTSLIGRDAAVAAVCAMLIDDGVRLLTLTGPGGVGKTRLALQIAENVPPTFTDSVVFVPLAALTDPALVLSAIAREVGLRETAAQTVAELLANHLRDRRLLLVLDNVEHVVGAAPQVATLLGDCPGLAVLATSRTRLHVSGEHRFPISPLALPVAAVRGSALPFAAIIATSPAVQLFVERAQAAEPRFILTDENAPAIADICHRLDGLPLAIELAAVRTRILSPAELLERLEPALPLLSGGPTDAPDRLRTMRNAIAWSYDLLTPPEQTLLQRLSVFVGGCTLEAAEHVGGTEPSPSPPSLSAVLETTAALIDASLVQRHDAGADTRLTMLETIREFALEQLAASGQMEGIAARHAAWCVAFAERAEPELSGLQQKAWFDRLEAEQPNMRTALHWFLAQRDAERGLHLASMLTWFWSSRSYFREAQAWLQAFLALPTSEAVRGRGLLDASNILHWLGHDDDAARLAHDALAIFRKHDDPFLAMCTLRRLGSIAIDREEFVQAERFLAESQVLLHVVPPPWDPRWDAAFATFLSGRLAAATNRGDEAIAHFTEAIATFGEVGDRGYVAAALGLQGAEWIKQGELPRARDAYATSLDLAIELADHTWVAWALLGAAHLAHGAGDNATAARLLAAATAMREAIGERRLPKGTLTPALQSAVEDESLAEEWTHGMRMPATDAVAMARALLRSGDDRHRVSGIERQPKNVLTAREHDVLRLLADGLGDKAIAATLGITRRTASQHVAAILAKLGADSRTAAVTRALRRGLL